MRWKERGDEPGREEVLWWVDTTAREAGRNRQPLEACGNPDCRWAFYDRSHSRAGAWCEMATRGSRIKPIGSGSASTD